MQISKKRKVSLQFSVFFKLAFYEKINSSREDKLVRIENIYF